MSGQIVRMPSGATGFFLDPTQVSERRRRPVLELIQVQGSGEMSMPQLLDMSQALILALLSDWDVHGPDGQKLPITSDTLLDLPGADYDALRSAALPLMSELMPDFGVTPDKDSPTSASSDSSEPSAPMATL